MGCGHGFASAARCPQCRAAGPQPVVDKEVLRKRFHAVILGAGYSEKAAQSILAEWHDKYCEDYPKYEAMLQRYERGDGDD